MNRSWMIYGANGYSGELVARHAVDRGMQPVLAGRNRDRIRALADELGCENRVFDLSDADAVRRRIADMSLVLLCAGPFSATSAAVVDACLRTETHYLDITGEIGVFESLFATSAEAERAGIVVLPGVGFDVVPSDCLAARLGQALPDAEELDLAFWSSGGMSRGTARTAIASLGQPNIVRRNGVLTPIPMGRLVRTIPFSDKHRTAMAIPWGDVSTAYRSIGVPNVTVYRTVRPRTVRRARMMRWFAWMLRTGWAQRRMKARVARAAAGPTVNQLETGAARLWGELRSPDGRSVRGELVTPNAYAHTAHAAVASVERVLSNDVSAPGGFLTPSRAFGWDFVATLPGVEWVVSPEADVQ